MSEQYYTESQTQGGFKTDAFIPLILLSISLIVLLGWQVCNASTQRNQFQAAITHQQPAVDQSKQAQASLAKLATDLLVTAKTDDTAKAIATKFGIQQNGAAADTSAPATPAASATP